MKKFSPTVTILTLICLAAFTSCGDKLVCAPPQAASADGIVINRTNTVDIFLDATLSMQGFITDGSFSYYQQSMPMLERAVIRNGGTVNFHKFGTEIAELPGRSYGDAQRKVFYTDALINKKTLIEKVLDRSNPEHLTIIVTDLFQERADINQLSELIKNKFISAELAVGVLAIKSHFNGMVFDVGSNNYSFSYASGGEASSLRPFYLLALGTHGDIANYFDTLVSGEMAAFPQKEQVIFSKFITPHISSWDGSQLTDSQGINEVNGVLVQPQGGEHQYKEFRIKGNARDTWLAADLRFERLPNVAEFENLKPSIEAFNCGAAPIAAGTETGSEGYVANDALSDALGITAAESGNGLQIRIDVDQSRLGQGQIAAYRIVLKPERYAMPAWVNEWNMTDEQIESWRTAGTLDGSKTYNLTPFLQTLWEMNKQVHDPIVADLFAFFRLD